MKSVRSPLANAPTKTPIGITGFDEITGGGTLSQTQPVLLALGLEVLAL
jgi:hypothetical protein